MGRLKNLYDRLFSWRRNTNPGDTVPIPPGWPGGKPLETGEKRTVHLKPKKSFKIRVPGLKLGKRVLAFILLVVNFLLSQATLLGPNQTLPIALFFFANSFILIDYLWKTRRKPKIEQ